MENLDIIYTRRSIRRYTDEEVTKDEEHLLLKAAMCSPNCVNNRSWAYVVVRDLEKIRQISEGLHPNAPLVKNVNFLIVVCGDMTLTRPGLVDYWVQDCAIASTSMLIAANGIGLGGCWYGVYPQEYKVNNITQILNLPNHIIPLNVLTFGHPAEQRPNVSEERFEEHKIHYNGWEEKTA